MGGANALVSFLLVPLYVHSLNPASFGTLQLVNMFISLSSMLCGLGMSNAFLRVYYNIEHAQRISALTMAIRAQLATVLLFFFLATVVYLSPVPKHLFGAFWSPALVVLWFLSLVSGLLVTMSFAYLRAQEEAGRFFRMGLLGIGSLIALNLLLLLVFHMGVAGILLANVLSNFVVAACVLRPYKEIFFENIPWRYEGLLGQLLGFGWPLVPTAFALWVMDLSDRYILNYYHGEAAVGVYSLGYKYASILLVCVTMMHTGWIPALMRVYKERPGDEAKQFYKLTAGAGIAILLLVSILLYALRIPVLDWIAPSQYSDASGVVGAVSLGFLFYGLYYILTGVVFITGNSKALLYGATMGALVNIGLNLYWIPTYAASGAAWATAVGYMVLFFVSAAYLLVSIRHS